jgi:hypothetical protein
LIFFVDIGISSEMVEPFSQIISIKDVKQAGTAPEDEFKLDI